MGVLERVFIVKRAVETLKTLASIRIVPCSLVGIANELLVVSQDGRRVHFIQICTRRVVV